MNSPLLPSNPMRHFGRLQRRASLRSRTPTKSEGGDRAGNRHPQGYLCDRRQGATEYNLKIIEIARTNTNAAFEHAQQLLGVKSPSEFIELSPHMRASNSIR